MNLLLVALRYQLKAGWDTFDLTSPDRSTDGIQIIQAIEAALIEVTNDSHLFIRKDVLVSPPSFLSF